MKRFLPLLLGLFVATSPSLCWGQESDEPGLNLRLLYQIPDIDTNVRLDASQTVLAPSFSLEDDLDADPGFFLPAFEIDWRTGSFGRFVFEYSEFRLKGATFLQKPIFFDGVNFRRNSPVQSEYEFRTLGASGHFAFPLDNWIDVSVIVAARYLKFYTSITDRLNFQAADDNVETLVPTIGLGIDLFLSKGLYVFGSYQALGYSLDGERQEDFFFFVDSGDDDSRIFTREWRAGVRYEFAPWVSARVEIRSLTLRLTKGKARMRQNFDGIAFGVEVKLF
jgi:hypothetical protein